MVWVASESVTAIGSATPSSFEVSAVESPLRSFSTGLSDLLKSAASSMAAEEKFEITRIRRSSGEPAESVRAAM